MRDGYFRRLWDFLTCTDLSLKEAEIGIGEDVASLVVEMKTRPTFRAKIRGIVAENLHSFWKRRAESCKN